MRKKKAKRKPKPKEVHDHHMERCIFAIVLLLAYLTLAVYKYGAEDGVGITVLTWAFFVLLTPVPFADLILELPLRLVTRAKMVVTHVFVWGAGALIVTTSILMAPDLFQTTTLLSIFYHVIMNPVPYWSLLFLCGMGTFLSVYIADEIMDEVEEHMKHHHRKHMSVLHMSAALLVFVGIVLAYWTMICHMGFNGNIEII